MLTPVHSLDSLQTAAPAWLNRAEYPFQLRRFDHGAGLIQHYVDEGSGETLVFVHGTPSWSFDFRQVIRSLQDEYRCIAVDHAGFGLSSKPAAADYSLQAHARRLNRLLDTLNAGPVTLVLHDFGGPIGLLAALEKPERVARIVFLNTWIGNATADPDFRKTARILRSPLLPFLYRRLNASPRWLMPASFGAHKLQVAVKRQFTAPFSETGSREGALAFARSLLHDQPLFESLRLQAPKLRDVPAHIVWGKADPVVKIHHLERLRGAFPHAGVTLLESSGHFPQEEEPEAVAAAIRQFMAQRP